MPLPRSVTRKAASTRRQELTPPDPNTLYACLRWLLGGVCLVLSVIAFSNGAPTRITVGLGLVALATLPCSPLPRTLRWVAGGLGLALT